MLIYSFCYFSLSSLCCYTRANRLLTYISLYGNLANADMRNLRLGLPLSENIQNPFICFSDSATIQFPSHWLIPTAVRYVPFFSSVFVFPFETELFVCFV